MGGKGAPVQVEGKQGWVWRRRGNPASAEAGGGTRGSGSTGLACLCAAEVAVCPVVKEEAPRDHRQAVPVYILAGGVDGEKDAMTGLQKSYDVGLSFGGIGGMEPHV